MLLLGQARHRKAVPRAVQPEGQESHPGKVLRLQEAANDLVLQGCQLAPDDQTDTTIGEVFVAGAHGRVQGCDSGCSRPGLAMRALSFCKMPV
jgi:hypothetical protein